MVVPAAPTSAAPPGDAALGPVAEAVLASRRYRWLAPDFVARIARDAAGRTRRPSDAVKETKRRLHQVFGAYVQELRPDRIARELEGAALDGPASLRDAARRMMLEHASTRERLPALDRFYDDIFTITGRPGVVLDLACGLGPLTLPWMALPTRSRYHAFDVDRRFVQVAEACLSAFGVEGGAALRDVVADPPDAPADVALLLKAIPCLERQAAGSAARLIDAVSARWLVASFPTRSLGGAGKGMAGQYRRVMTELVADRPWRVHELRFPLELVFAIDTAG